MSKEVSISIFAVIMLLAAVFMISYLHFSPTGFAILQGDQTNLSQGTFVNTAYNGSSVVLSGNQTTGTYTSKIFDAGNTSTWNNLTVQGSSNLVFNARICSVSDCSDHNFSTIDITNMNLSMTDRYFQYLVNFDSTNLTNITLYLNSVSIDYSLIQQQQQQVNTSASVVQPSGTFNSTSGIPITFNVVGNNLTCSYNVQNSSSAFVIINTTLTNCGNSTFNLNNAGSYTFNLYVAGSFGNAYQPSAFSIVLPSQTNTTQQTQNQTNLTTATNTTTPTLTQPVQQTVGVAITDIPTQNLNEDGTGTYSLSVQNTGTADLTNCVLTSDSPDWASASSKNQNIAAGASITYSLSLNVPKNSDLGNHNIGLTLTCAEATATKTLIINVIKTQIGFNLTSVNRVSSGTVRVIYSLFELANETQNVTVNFDLLDSSNLLVSNLSQNRNLSANTVKTFTANIPINSSSPLFQNQSQNVSLTLKTDYASSIYSGEYLKTIVLGAPTGGFLSGLAVLGGGTTSIVAAVIVLLLIIVVFFIVRKAVRKK
ncbi:MAG: hypothetical protein ABSG05_03340 [Candidatus Pacearchaeota archaeon]|jgi:hypothetical protein